MFDKLDFILEKYEELALKVSDPDIINNQPVWQKHVKEMGEMEPLVNKYKEYKMNTFRRATTSTMRRKCSTIPMRRCVRWPSWSFQRVRISWSR